VETPQHYENLPYRTVIQHETTWSENCLLSEFCKCS
jgi:hypothetical protein